MTKSMKKLDEAILAQSDNFVRRLAESQVEPEGRQLGRIWEYYFSTSELLENNRGKKQTRVKSHSA